LFATDWQILYLGTYLASYGVTTRKGSQAN
jgi:hypothetical protein